jgi:hypothetical protein
MIVSPLYSKKKISESGADIIVGLIKQKKAAEIVSMMDSSLKLNLLHENRILTGQEAIKESETNLKWIMKRFREVKKISKSEIEVLGAYFEGDEEMWQSRLMILFIEEKNGKTVIKEIKLEVGGMG